MPERSANDARGPAGQESAHVESPGSGQDVAIPNQRSRYQDVRAAYKVKLVQAYSLFVFASLVGLGILARMSVPLAEAIAGTDTKLDLTISVTINLALGAGLVVSVTWAVIQTRHARRFRNRNKALEGRLLQLQASVDLEN